MFLIFHSFALILIVLIFTFIGLLVFFRNRTNLTNISFVVFVITTTFWLITNYFADTPLFYSNALLWNKLAYAAGFAMGTIGIPFFLANFPTKGKLALFWRLNFLASSIFMILTVSTNLIVSRVEVMDWGTNMITGPLFMPSVIWGIIAVVGIIVTFVKKYQSATGIERVRLKYFILGFLGFLISAVILGLILPAITGQNT